MIVLQEQKELGRGMGNCDFKYVVTEELFSDAWYDPGPSEILLDVAPHSKNIWGPFGDPLFGNKKPAIPG